MNQNDVETRFIASDDLSRLTKENRSPLESAESGRAALSAVNRRP